MKDYAQRQKRLNRTYDRLIEKEKKKRAEKKRGVDIFWLLATGIVIWFCVEAILHLKCFAG